MLTMQLRRIIGCLQKLLYTVKRIRMSPTPTLNIYLFEGPIYSVEQTKLIFLHVQCIYVPFKVQSSQSYEIQCNYVL
jgi:hypothetical protein